MKENNKIIKSAIIGVFILGILIITLFLINSVWAIIGQPSATNCDSGSGVDGEKQIGKICGLKCTPDTTNPSSENSYCKNAYHREDRNYCYGFANRNDGIKGLCVECFKDSDCKSSSLKCDTETKECVSSGGGGCIPQTCPAYRQDDGSVVSYECDIWLDGCGGTINCGTCATGQCNIGKCVGGESCTPNIKECVAGSTNKFRVCSPFGIWGSAQTCPTGQICSGEGVCKNSPPPTCIPECSGKTCGASSTNNCGTCVKGSGCTVCIKSDPKRGCIQKCTPSCSGKTCGASDGCTGTCGPETTCRPACDSSCSGITCGENNLCGKVCGEGSGCKPPIPGTVDDDGTLQTAGCIPLPLDRELLLACIALSNVIGQTTSEPPPGYKICQDPKNLDVPGATCRIAAKCGFTSVLGTKANFCIEVKESCKSPTNQLCEAKGTNICCPDNSPCGKFDIAGGLSEMPYCKNNNGCVEGSPGYCLDGWCCDVGPDGKQDTSDDVEECVPFKKKYVILVDKECQPKNRNSCEDKGMDYCPGLNDAKKRVMCCPKDTCKHMDNGYPYCYSP